MNHQPLKERYIPIISMSYISILIGSAIISNKVIATPFGDLAAGSITGPLWFLLSDIIAEVYGFNTAKKIFWSAMICELITFLVITFILKLSSPESWVGGNAYHFVAGGLLQIYIYQFIAIILAWQINTRVILYWKVLSKGQYFWLRSIGSSGIGAIVFSCISPPLSLYGKIPPVEILHVVLWSILLKILCFIIFAFPANALTSFLKKAENITTEYKLASPFVRQED